MPDMDGFNLLEQVGLEMDLPVIMLSANSDPRLVMKGVTHGACDYLVKPVRLEELRNIWQHVIRKKKRSPDHQKKTSDEDKFHQGHADLGQDPSLTCNSDHKGKINKKRKDDDDVSDENEPDSDDPSSQKKPRVVWSIDLHRKFVTAVNQLGIEKAVPKRILDLMNVEGLTRENVASHLQKYRLYLRRISSNAAQQANLVAALGSKDAYMRMGSLDGFGTYQTLAGSGRLANSVLSPYTSSGMLGRLNSLTGVSLQNLTSSGIMQPNNAQNFNGPMNHIGQFPSIMSGSHNGNLIQGTSSSLSLDQLNKTKHPTCLGDFSPSDDSKYFAPVNSFTGSGAIGNIDYSSNSASSNSIMLQENCYPLNGGEFGNQSSVNRTSLHSDCFSVRLSGASGFLDPGKSNENLQNETRLMNFQSSSSHLTNSLNQGHLPLGNVRENQSSAVPSLLHPLDISATSISTPIENSRADVNCKENFLNSVPNFNQLHSQRWGDHKHTYSTNSDNVLSTLNSQLPASHGNQSLDQPSFSRQTGMTLVSRLNEGASTSLHQGETGMSSAEPRMLSNNGYVFGQTKQHGAFTSQSYDSFDDLMTVVVKPEHDVTGIGGAFALDTYSFGSCM
ncbi:winged helix/forkhead transcription factor [Lithospermum erythrorhizon]|uniref:Two-component response regulator n=1 Tax=Lithospermum erythrorhizon TaxID=34254 RepID=A0AAV3S085_LITER